MLTHGVACSLAFHYIRPAAGDDPERIKALILMGSMSTFIPLLRCKAKRALGAASYQPIYSNVQYTASKHAILGMMQALAPMCAARGMRCGSVHPWFMGTSPSLPLFLYPHRIFRHANNSTKEHRDVHRGLAAATRRPRRGGAALHCNRSGPSDVWAAVAHAGCA